eukprot:5830024-Pleurochrysis_carterae.AAC.1
MPGIVGIPSAALPTGWTSLLLPAGEMELLQVPAPKIGMWLAPGQLSASGGWALLLCSMPLPSVSRGA